MLLFAGYEKEVKMAFKVFNKDGFITEKELRWLFDSIGEKVTDRQIRQMMRAAEPDKEGRINYKQFSAMMKGILETQDSRKAGLAPPPPENGKENGKTK